MNLFEDIYKVRFLGLGRMWWKWHQNWCCNEMMSLFLTNSQKPFDTHTKSLDYGIIVDSSEHSTIDNRKVSQLFLSKCFSRKVNENQVSQLIQIFLNIVLNYFQNFHFLYGCHLLYRSWSFISTEKILNIFSDFRKHVRTTVIGESMFLLTNFIGATI